MAPDAAPEAVSAAAAPADSASVPAQAQQPESPAATAARLAELFPALFKGQPKPLKLRIQVDIQERAPGVFSKQALSAFFRRYTGATSYLIAVSKATQRFDLDGQPAGELTDEHRKVAADELVRRRANANAKREAEQAERRQRASLLRDFETTKLTTANFCALKGVALEALEGLLAQARAEALEDAQNPQRQHHGHGRPEHGRRDGQGRPGGKPGNGGPRREGQGPRGDGPRGEQRRGSGPREGDPRDGARRDAAPRGPRTPGGQGGQGGQGGGEQAKG
ncbi:MAG: prop effector ProQ [Aquabacterium sp.]|nr:MAG: prop effector ProQ [Aquabacterium sp.]